jgi:hypothetical protein
MARTISRTPEIVVKAMMILLRAWPEMDVLAGRLFPLVLLLVVPLLLLT